MTRERFQLWLHVGLAMLGGGVLLLVTQALNTPIWVTGIACLLGAGVLQWMIAPLSRRLFDLLNAGR